MMNGSLKRSLLRFLSYEQAEAVKTALSALLYYSGAAFLLSSMRGESRRGARILMFHSVSEQRTFWDNRISPDRFRETVRYLSRRFRIVPMAHIIERLRRNAEVPSDWVALTFDDGYADNAEVALPELSALKAPATFFVPSGIVRMDSNADRGQLPFLFFDGVEDLLRRSAPDVASRLQASVSTRVSLRDDASRSDAILRTVLSMRARNAAGHREELDRLSEICGATPQVPRSLYLSVDDLKRMDVAGMDVGSHGISHADLARCDEDEALREISASKLALEAMTGRPVTGFAYPFGKRASIGRRAQFVSQSGYDYAVTTEFGAVRAGADPFALPRIAVRDTALVRLKVNLMGIQI